MTERELKLAIVHFSGKINSALGSRLCGREPRQTEESDPPAASRDQECPRNLGSRRVKRKSSQATPNENISEKYKSAQRKTKLGRGLQILARGQKLKRKNKSRNWTL
jgi:hypothetical protein